MPSMCELVRGAAGAEPRVGSAHSDHLVAAGVAATGIAGIAGAAEVAEVALVPAVLCADLWAFLLIFLAALGADAGASIAAVAEVVGAAGLVGAAVCAKALAAMKPEINVMRSLVILNP